MKASNKFHAGYKQTKCINTIKAKEKIRRMFLSCTDMDELGIDCSFSSKITI